MLKVDLTGLNNTNEDAVLSEVPELKMNPIKSDNYIVKPAHQDSVEQQLINPDLIDPNQDKARAMEISRGIVNSAGNKMQFEDALSKLEKFGDETLNKSARVNNTILQRSSTSFSQAKKNGSKESKDVSAKLLELRNLTTDLAPTEKELGLKKFLGMIPGKRSLDKFVMRNQNAQEQINAIIEGLEESKNGLARDNAALQVERQNQVDSMQEIAKDRRVLDHVRETVIAEAERLELSGETEQAKNLRIDVLNKIEKRRMDMTTQFAVSVQAFMTLQMIQESNKELISGVTTAQNVTAVALKNAVVAAQALENQRKVIDAVNGMRETTGALLESNALMLQTNVENIKEINSSSAVPVESLRKSFEAIIETTDSIERFKLEANEAMSNVTDELTSQIKHSEKALKRAIEKDSDKTFLSIED